MLRHHSMMIPLAGLSPTDLLPSMSGESSTQTGASPAHQPEQAPHPGLQLCANITKTDHQFQLLIEALRPCADSAPVQRPAEAQPAAAFFPQFVPPTETTPSTGTSLLDIFTEVKASVLLDISRHEFEPGDLHKLDSRYRDKADRSVLELDGCTLKIKSESSTKDYPSLDYILTPLTVYFEVLAAFAPRHLRLHPSSLPNEPRVRLVRCSRLPHGFPSSPLSRNDPWKLRWMV